MTAPCRRTLRRLVPVSLALGLATTACKREEPPECAAMDALAADATRVAEALRPPFERALQAALAQTPATGDAPCAVADLTVPTVRLVHAEHADTHSSERLRSLAQAAEWARQFRSDCTIGHGVLDEPLQDGRAAVDGAPTAFDVVTIAREYVPARMVDSTTFEPGRLTADVLVYSYADERFVCAGTVTGTNRDEMLRDTRSRSEDVLYDDLLRSLIPLTRDALRAVE